MLLSRVIAANLDRRSCITSFCIPAAGVAPIPQSLNASSTIAGSKAWPWVTTFPARPKEDRNHDDGRGGENSGGYRQQRRRWSGTGSAGATALAHRDRPQAAALIRTHDSTAGRRDLCLAGRSVAVWRRRLGHWRHGRLGIRLWRRARGGQENGRIR